MKQFTLLAFASSIQQSEILQMDTHLRKIMELCPKLNPSFEVHCKIHHLSHYAALTRKYGPLNNFSTFRYERKHQFSKRLARTMRNFINPIVTIHARHQRKKAILDKESNFMSFNFWPAVSFEKPQLVIGNESTWRRLKSSERPFKLNKNILRKIQHGRELWFQTDEFFECNQSSKIICRGRVLRILKKRVKGSLQTVAQNSLEALDEQSANNNNSKYIYYDHLHFSNDFVFVDKESKLWLIKWIL
jgi:hypothetical protein